MKVCLVGNPNCGKTTVFNRLTGARQKVGNWAGVTVEKKVGEFFLQGESIEVVDLPGIYSLDQIDPGQDEAIAAAYIAQGNFDLVINIVDAANLSRNLVLTTQLLDLNTPLVVVANMVDVARQKGVTINYEGLEERLAVPVIPFVGATGRGLDLLHKAIDNARIASKELVEVTAEAEKVCAFGGEEDHLLGRTQKRFGIVRQLTDGLLTTGENSRNWSETVDRVVLSRWLGIPVFLLMMYLMFTVAINVGAVFIDFFDILFGAVLVDGVANVLGYIGAPQWIISILSGGIGAGIQLVATFVPVIGFLYLCLSLLEDSGYLSRAAFVVDRLMARIGLPGNAFVPLIVGFGCNVPAVMAARTMNRETDRLLTIVMAPFMSCGARLTVYALFAAAFFPSNGQNVVFLLYILGIAVAVFTGWLFRKQVFAAKAAPSFIEMPAYHLPIWRNIFMTTWHRLKGFILRAGKTIVLVVTALSFVNSIGTDGSFGNENSEKSVLSVIGKAITPVFSPLGIKEENWPATVGIFTGMFAKEAIVGTLDALYVQTDSAEESLGLAGSAMAAVASIADNFSDLMGAWGDPLGIGAVGDSAASAESQGVNEQTLTQMAILFDGSVGAFCYLVLILLYTPCVAVLGAVKREAGAEWMWVVVGWTTLLSYGLATVLYQLANWASHPVFSSLWIAGVVVVSALFVRFLRHTGSRVQHRLIAAVNVE